MGAAASVQAVYGDACKWFREYFDTQMYMEDFQSMDKDHDGGVTYHELQSWIKKKAETDGGSWVILMTNTEVLRFAHVQAAKYSKIIINRENSIAKKKIVGIDDFRTLLVQLFAISVFWVHFKNADDYNQESYDFGNLTLNLDEFRLAIRTLTGSHANETVTEEQIESDFQRLDYDRSGSLAFVEVCAYCCRFIDPTFVDRITANANSSNDGSVTVTEDEVAEKLRILHARKRAEEEQQRLEGQELIISDSGVDDLHVSDEILEELEQDDEDGLKKVTRNRTMKSRNMLAMDSLQAELDKNQAVAKFIEVKCETEATINELLKSDGEEQ